MHLKNQRGFTLLELMIALSAGLILIAGTISMMSNSSKTLKRHEINADMISAIRLSMDTIRSDVQSAGYFGRTRLPVEINGRTNSADPLPTLGGDCSPGFYTDIQRYIYASNGTNPFANTCLSGSGYVPGTDVLVVRYANEKSINTTTRLSSDTPVGSLNPNGLYLFSNPTGGTLFRGNNPPSVLQYPYAGDFNPDIGKRFYNAVTHVYYVADPPNDGVNETGLYRLELSLGSSNTFTPVLISSDIIDLQVLLGTETCNTSALTGANACTGKIDQYTPGDNPTMNLSNQLPSYEAVSRIRAVSIGLTALSPRIEGADIMTPVYHRLRNQFNPPVSPAAMYQSTTFHVRNSETLF